MPEGRLTVVGTGYLLAGQITQQALVCIERAQKLFYLLGDPATGVWLQGLNPSAESLHDAYADGKERADTYREMVERILAPLRRGLTVCAAFYGHPGICADPAHEAIRQARAEGHEARMLPGISSADCLFAELGVDPGGGCQMYEATGFLYRKRRFDPTCPLVLWQVGSIGISVYHPTRFWGPDGLCALAEVLLRDYPPDHEAVIYEAALLPVSRARVSRIPLRDLARAGVTCNSTLYVPPRGEIEYDWDLVRRLTPQA